MKHAKKILQSAILFASILPLAHAEIDYVPLEFRQVSGLRPFVYAEMNHHRFQLMVHAQAGFYAMTTHANAALIGLKNLENKEQYGIVAPGKVSTLGRSTENLALLEVGKDSVTNVKLLVFEVPQTEGEMHGMLGIRWLRDRKVIIDYDAGRLAIPSSPADTAAEDQRLVARGYVGHKMQWDGERGGFVITGTVNGVPAQFVVNSVAQSQLDTEFAARAKIQTGPQISEYGGPKGAVGKVFLSKKQVPTTVDGQTTNPFQPEIFDAYAYEGLARPPAGSLSRNATIGAEFMLANQAIIDFGSEMLFLPTR